jgi:hypothetical protein
MVVNGVAEERAKLRPERSTVRNSEARPTMKLTVGRHVEPSLSSLDLGLCSLANMG